MGGDTVVANDDLLELILLCLPARALLRFKSVSKHWLSFISDPNFTRRHFCNRQLKPSLLFDRLPDRTTGDNGYGFVPLSDDPSQVPPPPFTTQPHSHLNLINVIQSCNGLLLCWSRSKDYKHYYYQVYNPTTNHFYTIPTYKDLHVACWSGCWNLAFDPARSPYYKILYISNSKSEPLQFRISIYSSETRRWKVLRKTYLIDPDQLNGPGIYSNGAVHWLNCLSDKVCNYFNIEEERLGTVPMFPDSRMFGSKRYCFFREWKDHVHLVYGYIRCAIKYDVYELERDYSGWFVKYVVDLSIVFSSLDLKFNFEQWERCLHHIRLVLIVHEERDEDSYFVLQVGDDAIVRYNFVGKTITKLPISILGLKVQANFMRCLPYVESLHGV